MRMMNTPTIYAYKLYVPDRFHHIKVGYTEKNPQIVIFDDTAWAGLTPDIIMVESAVKADGSILSDAEFHAFLRQQGFSELQSGKDHYGWFECEPKDVIKAYNRLVRQLS